MRFAIGRQATSEGGAAVIHGGRKRRLGNIGEIRSKIFWWRQGHGDGDPAGVAREGGGGGGSDSGSKGYRYAGNETGSSQVGGRTCVETRGEEIEREKGNELVDPPGGHWAAKGKEGFGLRSIERKNKQQSLVL